MRPTSAEPTSGTHQHLAARRAAGPVLRHTEGSRFLEAGVSPFFTTRGGFKMPWLKPAHRVVRLSTGGIGTHFEKLEDRIAVAATATLAAGGIIFDGAPQLFAHNEAPPLPRSSGGGST